MVVVVVVVVVVQTGDVRVLLQDIRTKDKTNQTPLVEITGGGGGGGGGGGDSNWRCTCPFTGH